MEGHPASRRASELLAELPYELRGLLGQGGMGSVYRAYDPRLEREVALKVLNGEQLSGVARARFRREAEVAARLVHPHVVALHGIHELEGGGLALVFELVPAAGPLDQRWGPELRERIRLLRDAAQGVAAAHALGVIHRDLKPDNLLVDALGRVRVADFGVAFASDADGGELTATGSMLGTPSFMAPEQVSRQADPTPASDVWSLGVLLYLALSDELPFPGPDLGSFFSQLNAGLTPSLRERIASAPPRLRTLLSRALSPTPTERLPDAQTFALGLEEWLEAPAKGSTASRPLRVALLGLVLCGLTLLGVAVVGERAPPAPPPPSDSPPLARLQVEPSLQEVAPPPRELVAELAALDGARASLAALQLLRDWPESSAAREARPHVTRLRREPLLRLQQSLPPELRKKDWEVGFRATPSGYEVCGLADRAGLVLRWDLRSGDVLSRRTVALDWSVASVFAEGGLTVPNRAPGLLRLDLDARPTGPARDVWLLPQDPRAGAETLLSYDWAHGQIWWISGARLGVLDPAGARPPRELALPKPTDKARVLGLPQRQALVSLVTGEEERTAVWRVTLPEDPGQPPDWEELFWLPGGAPEVDASSSGILATTSAGVHALYREGSLRTLRARPPGGGHWPLLFRWRDERSVWVFGHSQVQQRAATLELCAIEGEQLRVLARRTLELDVGSARFSPCGRFLAIGLAGDPRSALAAEIWYLGPEVLEPL